MKRAVATDQAQPDRHPAGAAAAEDLLAYRRKLVKAAA